MNKIKKGGEGALSEKNIDQQGDYYECEVNSWKQERFCHR